MHIEKVICALVCVVTLLGCDVETTTSVEMADTIQQVQFNETLPVLTVELREGNVWTRRVEVPLPVPTSYVDVDCQSPEDCDDSNPCTVDVCELGVCQHGPVEDGGSCADSNVCDGAETCHAGICTRSARPMLCDDGNPDTDDFCDPKLGRCRSRTLCSDGRRSCQADAECDDGNPDTDDFCDAGTCTSSPVEGCYGLEVNDCWQFYANVNSIHQTTYPFQGGWERCRYGNCRALTWCGNEFVTMNVESTSSYQGEELSRASVWAIDWHHCNSYQSVNRAMFIGAKPESMGCMLWCNTLQTPDGSVGPEMLVWQCHQSYLSSGG